MTESLRSLQSELFNEVEQEAVTEELPIDDSADEPTITMSAHDRKRGGRKPLPEDLPRVEVIHDLADADKVCPHDG
jgi:transposase